MSSKPFRNFSCKDLFWAIELIRTLVVDIHTFVSSVSRVSLKWVCIKGSLTAPLTIIAGPPLGPENRHPRRVSPSIVLNSTSFRFSAIMILRSMNSAVGFSGRENFLEKNLRVNCLPKSKSSLQSLIIGNNHAQCWILLKHVCSQIICIIIPARTTLQYQLLGDRLREQPSFR